MIRLRRNILVFSGMTLLAVIIASSVCKNYWGFYFTRPSPPNPFVKIDGVVAVLVVHDWTEWNVKAGADRWTPAQCASDGDNYDFPHFRAMALWKDHDILPPSWDVELPPQSLVVMQAYLSSALDLGPKFPVVQLISGVLAHGVDSESHQTLYLGGETNSMSNDHYAYFDIVWTKGPHGWETSEIQHFFLDRAGWEAVTFWKLFWTFEVPALAVALIWLIKFALVG